MFVVPQAKILWNKMTKTEQQYILDIEEAELADMAAFLKKIKMPIKKETAKVLRDRQMSLGPQTIYPKMTIQVVDDILIINRTAVYGVEVDGRIIDEVLPELALKTIREVYQKTSGKRRKTLVLWRRALVHYVKEHPKKEGK